MEEIRNNDEIVFDIKNLIKKYPNDHDLGSKIRKYFNDLLVLDFEPNQNEE